MKNIFIAAIVSAAMLFSGLAVFGQQVDVTQLTANGDWAVAPDSSGVVVSTAENGFAEYLIEVNTEHGYSSATVSVTNSGYFVDEFGDSAAFLVVPHVLQREHELAFAIRLVSPDSNELIDINSASSSASQTWLDEYLVWVTQALGDGWSELDVEIENFVGVDGGDIYNASATGEAAYQPISFGNDDDEELPWYHGESIGRWFFGLIGLGGVEKNIESNKNRLNNLEEGPLEAGGNFHLDSTTRHTLETAAEGYIEYFAAGGGIGPVTKGGIVRRAPRRTVIGKWDPDMGDIKGLRPGENSLLKHLPDQGSPRANWKQNSSVLRREIRKGNPIRDSGVNPDGTLIDYPGSFLNAERNLLRNQGWTFDPSTGLWSPK